MDNLTQRVNTHILENKDNDNHVNDNDTVQYFSNVTFPVEKEKVESNISINYKKIKSFCSPYFGKIYNKITEKVEEEEFDINNKKNVKYQYDSIDVFANIQKESLTFEEANELKQKNIFKRLYLYIIMEQSWLLLVILGISSALIAILMEWFNSSLLYAREYTGTYFRQTEWCDPFCGVFSFLTFVGLSVLLCTLGGIIVRYISPQAAGSGLPEMKSILSGVVLPRYLSYRTFLAKTIALICVVSGGLSIGKEGPYVHICSVIANQLTKMNIFKKIRSNDALKFQLLSAGCAVGVSTVFGAPIGGVLFSIEVTTTYFVMQNLWKSFFCAVCGALIVKLGGQQGLIAMFSTSFESNSYHYWELIVFALIGITGGYLGAWFVKIVLKLVRLRRTYKILATTRYTQLIIIAFLTATCVYPFQGMTIGDRSIIDNLFGDLGQWTEPNRYSNLLFFMIIKFVLTVISLGLPIPCGLYTPVFMIGAAGGRLIGEILHAIFQNTSVNIVAGGYAVVGAAALSAGVTRTLSTAVIVFELTGQLQHLIPVLVAVVLATGIGNVFSRSSYDTLLEQKRLPYMPPYGNIKTPPDRKTAVELMNEDLVYISEKSTYHDVSQILEETSFTSYPIVESEGMILKSLINRTALEEIIDKHDLNFKHDVDSQIMQDLYHLSSRDDTVQRLKKHYRFDPSQRRQSVGENDMLDDEDDIHAEEKLYNIRLEYFDEIVYPEILSPEYQSNIDSSPFQIPSTTPFHKIHFMFSMLGLNVAFITQNSSFVGVITKKSFLDLVAQLTK
eukprot:TRINITY_DN15776_c0_g1_i1.p1 TRINITY_DN15776_c0_g1~~TRINITY_DN15776_c0_g1_i1.p1  ORF type:complete len:786 (+),score=233.63 TRINITY_DN15776_c0_g1_i1:46-2403(+)